MPDKRTIQTIAERLEIQLDRFPNRLHRCRRWFTLAGGLLPLLVVGVFLGRGDHSIFMSRPVAESHQHLQSDCKTCHRTPWQPVLRLTSTNPHRKSVSDGDCRQCHVQRKEDHHVKAMAKGVPDCADCHLEHRGAIRLTDQADQSCVKCHQSYDHHPQFALSQSREDTAALHFSHAGHLVPLDARWTSETDAAAPAVKTQLSCANCHELDDNGQFMKPIVYEKHCADCHPLRFSGKLDLAAAANKDDVRHRLPHEKPEVVQGVMRQRLIDYARRHPEEVLPPGAESSSRLPNRQTSRVVTSKQEWEWVEEELQVLNEAIFRTPNPMGNMQPSNACLKCHVAGSESTGGSQAFAIAPTKIPRRWMPKSRFRHDRHLKMDCVQCHRAGSDGVSAASVASSLAIGSTTVKDILMPHLERCQTCHGVEPTSPLAVHARANCTECHDYHHDYPAKATDGRATE